MTATVLNTWNFHLKFYSTIARFQRAIANPWVFPSEVFTHNTRLIKNQDGHGDASNWSHTQDTQYIPRGKTTTTAKQLGTVPFSSLGSRSCSSSNAVGYKIEYVGLDIVKNQKVLSVEEGNGVSRRLPSCPHWWRRSISSWKGYFTQRKSKSLILPNQPPTQLKTGQITPFVFQLHDM